nr:GDP-mannose 4,6-dehydratase [uncultured Victivallis sp.]
MITGRTGQNGSWLTELLLEKGYEVQPDGAYRKLMNLNKA